MKTFNLILSPKYFSLTQLYKNVNGEQSQYRQDILLLEFWRKALQPVFSILLVILAASFVFGPTRDPKNRAKSRYWNSVSLFFKHLTEVMRKHGTSIFVVAIDLSYDPYLYSLTLDFICTEFQVSLDQ